MTREKFPTCGPRPQSPVPLTLSMASLSEEQAASHGREWPAAEAVTDG